MSDDPRDVLDLRKAERHVALEPIKAYFGSWEVIIHDLSEGGFQIEHPDPLKLASSALLTFDNPKTFETIEFRVKVVWSRLSSTPNTRGRLLYRSGLRIEQADERNRTALRRLLSQVTRPDTESLDRKRKKLRTMAKEKATRPIIKFIRQTELPSDQVQMILQARKYLRSNPMEALRWYNRAKFSLNDEQIRAIDEMNIHFRDDVLAVWEYLERRLPIAIVSKVFEENRY
jgi:hypothetical protein